MNCKNTLAYWFFWAIGIIGISHQLYQYVQGNLILNYAEMILLTIFSTLIFKPTIMIDILKAILYFFTKTDKTNEKHK